MRSDIDRWNTKYENRRPGSSIEPDPLLREHLDLLRPGGLCIDLAGGTGDNGLFLAGHGYDSVIVDGSETGLRLCRRKAAANGLDPMLVVGDLDRFILPGSRFDVVLVFRYLNRSLIEPIRSCLKKDGLLFFRTFNQGHRIDHPRFPEEYVLGDGELTGWFGDWDCVATDDGASTDATTYYWVGRK